MFCPTGQHHHITRTAQVPETMSLIAQLDMTLIQNRLTDLLTATHLQAIQTISSSLYTRTLADLFQQIDSYI